MTIYFFGSNFLVYNLQWGQQVVIGNSVSGNMMITQSPMYAGGSYSVRRNFFWNRPIAQPALLHIFSDAISSFESHCAETSWLSSKYSFEPDHLQRSRHGHLYHFRSWDSFCFWNHGTCHCFSKNRSLQSLQVRRDVIRRDSQFFVWNTDPVSPSFKSNILLLGTHWLYANLC